MNLTQQALSILIQQSIPIPYEYSVDMESPNYPIIIKDKTKNIIYFFLRDKIGMLFFDGWDKGTFDCGIGE